MTQQTQVSGNSESQATKEAAPTSSAIERGSPDGTPANADEEEEQPSSRADGHEGPISEAGVKVEGEEHSGTEDRAKLRSRPVGEVDASKKGDSTSRAENRVKGEDHGNKADRAEQRDHPLAESSSMTEEDELTNLASTTVLEQLSNGDVGGADDITLIEKVGADSIRVSMLWSEIRFSSIVAGAPVSSTGTH